MNNKCFSYKVSVFQGKTLPEEGFVVGYSAIIEAYSLGTTFPAIISLISTKNKRYTTDGFSVLTPRHQPKETLYDQLVFALKYEGVQLLILKKLFAKLTIIEITQLVQIEPLGQYSRKLWFLYEWLLEKKLPIEDLKSGNFVSVIDEKLQYASATSVNSSRHRIKNNIPGTVHFCPLVYKTEKLEKYISANLSLQKSKYINAIHKDVMQRANAFLLLKDSKASFSIEGENPKIKRAARWGTAIGQAGEKELTIEELKRLQQLVIENPRFLTMGFREKGGFVGEHDRVTGEPLPDHISAKWQDLESLMDGLLQTNKILINNSIDAVIAAACIAFGFVFIHPFEDGNGRIHRYLIHHVLAQKNFAQQGVIFPVSAAILNDIVSYRKVLEHYSHPLLDMIEWKETKDHNIEVINETIDYYRYFDATKQAEFLYDCVQETIDTIIPKEVDYLIKYDFMKSFLENEFEMPDKMVALVVRFLDQNNGVFSKRAIENEFTELSDHEIQKIEKVYKDIFITK
jgi:hypothetical protein